MPFHGAYLHVIGGHFGFTENAKHRHENDRKKSGHCQMNRLQNPIDRHPQDDVGTFRFLKILEKNCASKEDPQMIQVLFKPSSKAAFN
ncbi:hypothetical protein TNIN_81121 [Trichonephila inaurata madagascariensis]|uniref:Uncharacterized protein n=1 Tax=Trichonephila inaurata madagascariensis TaxID=2747483 RepID=A0A8X6X692_9ARAC|nr:hypothetical protein TNIN_81121 [Trichonephila inaurata madagascariensis]